MRTLRSLLREPSSNTGITTQFAAVRAEMRISQLFHTNKTSENLCQRLDAVVVRDLGGDRRVPAGHPSFEALRTRVKHVRYRLVSTTSRSAPSAKHMSQKRITATRSIRQRRSLGASSSRSRAHAVSPRPRSGIPGRAGRTSAVRTLSFR